MAACLVSCRQQLARAAICAGLLFGCESAQERCVQARASAERAWRAHVDALHIETRRARALQGEATEKLSRDVEPRLSAAATASANARYDRNTDAWMRAYQAGQTAACAADAECTRLRRDNRDAIERVTELAPKLAQATAALNALHADAEHARQQAERVTPELGNALLTAAKEQSVLTYEACKGVALPHQGAAQ